MKKDSLKTVRVAEAIVRKCSVKKVFLKISQNSQENTCARLSFLIKLQAFLQNASSASKNTFSKILRNVIWKKIKIRDVFDSFMAEVPITSMDWFLYDRNGFKALSNISDVSLMFGKTAAFSN